MQASGPRALGGLFFFFAVSAGNSGDFGSGRQWGNSTAPGSGDRRTHHHFTTFFFALTLHLVSTKEHLG